MLGSSEVNQNQFHEILGFCCDVVDVFVALRYDVWCCATQWLVSSILGQNAGFVFIGWEIQCKMNSSLDFLAHEDETNVLSWNVGHQWHSDRMPYLRRMKTVMNSAGKVIFLEWDWSDSICKLKVWSSELWHHALLLVVAIILQSHVSCIIIVENGSSWFFQNVANHQQD